MRFSVVIPARYGSSRLPGKPLADIGGKPMVVRVAQQARRSGASEVIVATDHSEIAAVVSKLGYDVVMTRGDHPSGTDRIAEVAALRRFGPRRIVVNVQGDEPLIAPTLIRNVAYSLESHRNAHIATAAHALVQPSQLTDPNVVKVVLDLAGYALYFSRAPIPYARDAFAEGVSSLPKSLPVYRHVGIYAYRASFLRDFARLKTVAIERYEALEQLRALAYGYRISVAVMRNAPHPGVDTVADLARARAVFRKPKRIS